MNTRSNPLKMVLAAAAISCMMTACTDSSDTSSSTTTTTTTPTMDTITGSGTTPANDMNASADTAAGRVATGKKKGKATAKMMDNSTAKIEADKSGVYENTEIRPAYPGGQSALDDYINSRIEYPQTAIDNGKQGMVQVQFVVDENGKVTDVKTIGNKVGDGLDEEASRVVANMPKWTPGMVKGKKVKTRLVIPITYMIEE